jgi:hypothetical protein
MTVPSLLNIGLLSYASLFWFLFSSASGQSIQQYVDAAISKGANAVTIPPGVYPYSLIFFWYIWFFLYFFFWYFFGTFLVLFDILIFDILFFDVLFFDIFISGIFFIFLVYFGIFLAHFCTFFVYFLYFLYISGIFWPIFAIFSLYFRYISAIFYVYLITKDTQLHWEPSMSTSTLLTLEILLFMRIFSSPPLSPPPLSPPPTHSSPTPFLSLSLSRALSHAAIV